MGKRVTCTNTYCRHDAEWFTKQLQGFCDEILMMDDLIEVGDLIARIQPSTIFGTELDSHISNRLDIPRGVISSPVQI